MLYVYLVVLPAQFKDCRDPNDPNNGTYPVWLQDAGEFEVHPKPIQMYVFICSFMYTYFIGLAGVGMGKTGLL